VPQKELKRPGKEEVRIRQKVVNINPKKLAFFGG
jgi:NADPH:quinone reductase-like Zn-dependent oxidoreductase